MTFTNVNFSSSSDFWAVPSWFYWKKCGGTQIFKNNIYNSDFLPYYHIEPKSWNFPKPLKN